ncbi:hypothetical protein DPEC_G00233970 [Dallia pectoralis]|uniref:Uncharacterized protein n=1 Tax=Dallia pectoralis TaxID=75939 RepID=A0ACC2FXI8_DALPE|nr:hypothetical protein DPEC_G00233970 [Dallia pectoralis]
MPDYEHEGKPYYRQLECTDGELQQMENDRDSTDRDSPEPAAEAQLGTSGDCGSPSEDVDSGQQPRRTRLTGRRRMVFPGVDPPRTGARWGLESLVPRINVAFHYRGNE